MLLKRYLREGKRELLKKKIESATRIQFKIIPRLFISESRLKEQKKSNNK